MAIQFPDNNPTATSNDKTVHTKVVRINGTAFSLPGTTGVLAVLPADSTILGFWFWKKTQLSGGGVTAATLSIGIPGTPANFVNTYDVFTPAAGTNALITPVTNIMQNYNVPVGPDIPLFFTGVAVTGNPTAGEIYVTVQYVR